MGTRDVKPAGWVSDARPLPGLKITGGVSAHGPKPNYRSVSRTPVNPPSLSGLLPGGARARIARWRVRGLNHLSPKPPVARGFRSVSPQGLYGFYQRA